MRTAKQILKLIHRWLGLTIGAWFVLAGLTGSFLVWYQEIDEWLNPELTVERPGARWLPLEDILAAVQRTHPEKADGPWEIGTALHAHGTHEVRFPKPPERANKFYAPLMVTVNPYTAEVTSSRYWGEYLATFIFEIHADLLMGKAGYYLVGILGAFAFLSTVLGAAVWWPRRAQWRHAFKIEVMASRARTLFDLHRVPGAISIPLLMLLTLTGFCLVFTGAVRSLVELATPVPLAHEDVKTAPQPSRPRISITEALARSEAVFPRSTVRWIATPEAPDGVYRIDRRQDGEGNIRFPASRVWIDPYDGRVLKVFDPMRINRAGTLFNLVYPLHNGEALGLLGRFIMFVGGFFPLLLFVTGFLRWRGRIAHSRRLSPNSARAIQGLTTRAG